MTHNYFYPIGTVLSFFFLSITLNAQWSTMPGPGKEVMYKAFNTGTGWVALVGEGCFYSGDDGLTWSKTLAVNGYSSAIQPVGTEIYLVSKNKGLYHSSDQGQTWVLESNQTHTGTANPDGVVVTDNAILYETSNAVYRYNKANPGNISTVFDGGQLSPQNALELLAQGNELWLSVKDSLMHSNDDGNTWTLVHEGFRARGFAIHGDTLMLSTETGVQRSVNNGLDWSEVLVMDLPYHIGLIGDQWFVGTNPGTISKLFRSSDGGASWATFSPVLDQALLSNVAGNGSTLHAWGNNGMARSTDGGQYWELQGTGLPFGQVQNAGGRISKVGDYLSLNNFFSDDNGQTWFQPLLDARYAQFPPGYFDDSYFTVDFDGKIYRSHGDIRHWQPIGVQFPAGLLHRFFVAGSHFYCLEFAGFNVGPAVVYASTDGGVNWVATGGVVDNIDKVVAHGNYLFEWRSGDGLVRSLNGGVDWEPVGAGLDLMGQESAAADLYSDGINLFVYGYVAIMVSKDNGLTFNKISNNLPMPAGDYAEVEYLISDGNIQVVLTRNGIFLSEGLNDQWFDIGGNLPNEDFDKEKILWHNGNVILDNGEAISPLWQRAVSSMNLAEISGTVWHDDNNNGQQDPGELPYAGAFIQAGAKTVVTSDHEGKYSLMADLNNDTLLVKKNAEWVGANPAFYIVSASESGKDFGLYFPPNITDLAIDLTNQSVFRPGFTERIYISYKNFGTEASDAVVRFVPKKGMQFQKATPVADYTIADTLFWNLTNLAAMSEGKIIVEVKVHPNTIVGTYVDAFANITPSQADANIGNNQFFFKETVFNTFNPNDKRCNWVKISPGLIQQGEKLVYTIRFQNNGTDTAEFVRIADTLDYGRLEMSTFQVLATSHPCSTTLSGDGIVSFFFDELQLPPSNANEPESFGFVKYSINGRSWLDFGDEIRNTAYIYFDDNVPVVTNTALVEVSIPLGTSDISGNSACYMLGIAPNPTSGLLKIQTGENLPGELRVFNGTGMMVHSKQGFSDKEILDLNNLPAGQYILEWQSAEGHKKAGRVILLK